MIWAFVIAGVICIASLGYAKIEHSSKVAAEAETKACASQLTAQNSAIEAWRAEGAKKAQDAAKALAKATGKAKVWEDNALRLQTVLANRKPTDPQDCKAAWQEIRK